MSNSKNDNKNEFFQGVEKYPYTAVSRALEIIPRTLIQNCGANVVRELTVLRAKHNQQPGHFTWGIDGETGQIVDMHQFGIWEPITVKMQTIKTAIEVREKTTGSVFLLMILLHILISMFQTAILLLRIDDIVSGTKKASTLIEGPGQGDGKRRREDEDKPTDESN